jgi:hypothetical protein
MKMLIVLFLVAISAVAQTAPAVKSSQSAPAKTAPASAPKAAQPATATPASNQASIEEVNELLALLKSRQSMEAALETMKEQMRRGQLQGFELGLQKKGVTLTAEQKQRAQKRLDAIVDEMFTQMPYDEMMAASAEIYRKHFTSDDIKALLAFYRTPSGQKFLTEMPALVQESMRAGSDIMMKRVPEIMERIDKRMDELAAEFATNPPAAKQP